jgi:GT2 family glycosyltransferase
MTDAASKPPAPRPGSRLFFGAAAGVMIACCLKGGGFGFIGEPYLDLNFFSSRTVLLPAGRFIFLFSFTWVISLFLLLFFPKNLSVKKSALIIIVLSTVCRLALIPHEPSDDMNRYLWEGRLLNEGINPYHHAPAAGTLADLAKDDPFHRYINHPENPAAYPPLVLYLFSIITRIDYGPAPIKMVMILFDLGAIGFLLGLLNRRKLDLRWSILYSLNPVILYSFAGQGHFDAVQNFFLLGALVFHQTGKWRWMFIFAGLAIQTKYVAALAVPFLINRENFRYGWVILIPVVAPYLPLIDGDWRKLFSCIIKFGEAYAFNGSIHALLRVLLGGIHPATTLCKILLIGALVFGYRYFSPRQNSRFAKDPVPGMCYSIGALLLLAPTVHFWYLSWIMPFVALRPALSWIVLSLTIGGYFVTNGIYHHTGEWRLPVWGYLVQWLPFYAIFINDILLFRRRLQAPYDPSPPRSVSVVVPAKNEADRIQSCIEALSSDPAVSEIIVVDGLSTDETVVRASRAGARVIQSSAAPENAGGRGGQIHTGIMAAIGDVVAVVHADTLVSAPAFTRVLELLGKNPTVSGGAVGSRFDRSGWPFALIEPANEFRVVFLGISFGDQVQFFRRRPVVETDLFPRIPLMEDVEFSIRLHWLGRQIFLFGDALVSSRRWRTAGAGNAVSIVRRTTLYLWKRLWEKPDTLKMYRSYYGMGGG